MIDAVSMQYQNHRFNQPLRGTLSCDSVLYVGSIIKNSSKFVLNFNLPEK
jgi:hypothetical protein